MKAILTREQNGKFDDVGMRNRMVTAEYKTLSGLLNYGVPRTGYWRSTRVRVEVFYDIHDAQPSDIIYLGRQS